jgi:hypothetical protein
MVRGSNRMDVGKGLMYPHETLLDDVQIDASAYAVVKVNMVHENVKNMMLKLPPDDMTLTPRDAITRRVQWIRTSINVGPLAIASTLTTASQSHTAPGLIFPETQPDHMQSCPSPIREQPCPSPPQTRSTTLPAPNQTHPLLLFQRQ